jgi:hypothetical protein
VTSEPWTPPEPTFTDAPPERSFEAPREPSFVDAPRDEPSSGGESVPEDSNERQKAG